MQWWSAFFQVWHQIKLAYTKDQCLSCFVCTCFNWFLEVVFLCCICHLRHQVTECAADSARSGLEMHACEDVLQACNNATP